MGGATIASVRAFKRVPGMNLDWLLEAFGCVGAGLTAFALGQLRGSAVERRERQKRERLAKEAAAILDAEPEFTISHFADVIFSKEKVDWASCPACDRATRFADQDKGYFKFCYCDKHEHAHFHVTCRACGCRHIVLNRIVQREVVKKEDGQE